MLLKRKTIPVLVIFVLTTLLGACSNLPMPTAYVTSEAPTIVVPTFTPEPTLQPTPTEVTSSAQGTAIPLPSQPVSIDNAASLMQIAHWGSGAASDLVWAADGKTLIVSGGNGFTFFDATNLNVVRVIESPSPLRAMAISPDGTILAGGMQNGWVGFWDTASGELRGRLAPARFAVVDIAFSLNGNALAASWENQTERTIRVVDPKNPQAAPVVSATIRKPAGIITDVAMTAAGDYIRYWSAGGTLNSSTTPKVSVRAPVSLPTDNANRAPRVGKHSPDSRRFAAAYGPTVYVFSSKDGKMGQTYSLQSDALAFAWSNDSSLLAAVEAGHVTVWKTSDGTVLREFDYTSNNPNTHLVAFSADQMSLALLSEKLHVWRLDSDQPRENAVPEYITGVLGEAAFAPDSQSIVVAQLDGSLRRYSLPDGKVSAGLTLAGMNAKGLTFSPDTNSLAASAASSQVQLYQVSDGAQGIAMEGNRFLYGGLAYSKDGQMVAAPGGDNQIVLLRPSDGGIISTIPVPAPVSQVAFSPDGSLVVGQSNSQALVFQVSDGAARYTFDGYSNAISPDGSLLAVAWGVTGDNKIRVYQLSDGQLRKEFAAPGGKMAFSSDNQVLAVSGDKLNLWSIEKGTPLITTSNPNAYARIFFSPDGKLLAQASPDGRLVVWGAP